MDVLGYLPELKRVLGLAFGAYFLHDFSIKMFLIKYSIDGKSFKVIPFFFSRYQTKFVIKFLVRQLMTSFILDQPLKQWLTGRKRGEDGNTKT